jgi:hypothetical protein
MKMKKVLVLKSEIILLINIIKRKERKEVVGGYLRGK